MGKASPVTGSLDMLLDTMSNTFGGVCFIALLIAIMSVNLPSDNADDGEDDFVETERRLADMRTEELSRRVEELKKAIEMQRETLAVTNGAISISVSEMLSGLSSNETAVAKLKHERAKLEGLLFKAQSEGERLTKDAESIDRQINEMKERLDRPVNFKSRPVRTPVERRIQNLKTVSIWLRYGRCYVLDKGEGLVDDYVNIVGDLDSSGLPTWDVSVKYSTGVKVTPEFFHSDLYMTLISALDSNAYLRIFTDADSFEALCMFRDDMIRRRMLYNWIIRKEDTIHFISGYDGHVQ